MANNMEYNRFISMILFAKDLSYYSVRYDIAHMCTGHICKLYLMHL